MTETIFFDESCIGWHTHPEVNKVFLLCQEEALRARFSAYGYLYSVQVREYYGAPWDPREQVNNCYLAEDGELVFDYAVFPDYTMITIWQIGTDA